MPTVNYARVDLPEESKTLGYIGRVSPEEAFDNDRADFFVKLLIALVAVGITWLVLRFVNITVLRTVSFDLMKLLTLLFFVGIFLPPAKTRILPLQEKFLRAHKVSFFVGVIGIILSGLVMMVAPHGVALYAITQVAYVGSVALMVVLAGVERIIHERQPKQLKEASKK